MHYIGPEHKLLKNSPAFQTTDYQYINEIYFTNTVLLLFYFFSTFGIPELLNGY